MLKADSVVDWSNANPDQLNPEFRRRWIWEASNVSDETLQDLWARLLAGELEAPGSVSNDTMSIARDLTKERAEEFQILCSATLCSSDGVPIIVVGCGQPGANSLQPFGLSYNVLMRLAHHRLIVSSMNSRLNLPLDPSEHTILVRHQELSLTLRWPDCEGRSDAPPPIRGIMFTPAGEELFAVVEKIPVPDYREAVLEFLEAEGWVANPVAER